MPFLTYKEKKIFYQIKGNETEKAIIFIHGSGGNSNLWKHQLNDIDGISSKIAIDLPSHAQSDKFSELSLELYVDVLNVLIDSLKLKEVILAGQSLGGAVIQSYYFKYPEKVSALVLIATGARLRVLPSTFEILKKGLQEFLKSSPIGAFYKETSKEITDYYIKEASKTEREVFHDDYSICDRFDVMDKMNLIKIPCLIICGKDDKLTPPKYGMYFNDKIERSELILIDKAGHIVMLEKPGEVNQSITAFIEKYLKQY
jgi:pimeloyl-ACP methyl ester carboxylesterase